MDIFPPKDFDAVIELVLAQKGVDLRSYRRQMLKRRIESRITQLIGTFSGSYVDYLQRNAGEVEHLIDEIGVNVSEFFRDPLVFELIESRVLPAIKEEKRRKGSKEIRVWSVGCAGGEEAYSIAILIHRILGKDLLQWTPYIFASDIDSGALKIAAAASYPRNAFLQTKLGILETYFTPSDSGYVLKPHIKNMVRFSQKDCTTGGAIAPDDSVFGTFDLVLCRNVLIYFNSQVREQILHNISETIAPRGFLILGDSESLSPKAALAYHRPEGINNIFRKIS